MVIQYPLELETVLKTMGEKTKEQAYVLRILVRVKINICDVMISQMQSSAMFMVRDKLYSKQEVDGITQFRPKESE
jgi:hypothetical protein